MFQLWVSGSVLVTLPVAMTKQTKKQNSERNFGEKGLLLAHSLRVQFIMAGRHGDQGVRQLVT